MALPRVIETVHVRSMKRGAAAPSSSRPARLIVIPGKIEIISTETKFPTIYIKPSDLVKPPKRAMGKTASWISLDFIQNFDAKFQYVNLQADASKTDELLETLSYAWSGTKPSPSNKLNLFSDNADDIARPVHKPPPNAKAKPPVDRSTRMAQNSIQVDVEGSAAHSGFHSDFNESKMQPQKKQQPAEKMQDMFAEYGIPNDKDTKDAAPVPVHNKPQQPIQKKKNVVPSYSSMASKHNKEYRPVDLMVDKPKERREGVSERSFYGNNKMGTSVLRNTSMNKQPMSTKDSLDNGPYRGGRVTMTKGIRDGSPENERRAQAGSDDDSENVLPSQEKSFQRASTSDGHGKTNRAQSSSSMLHNLISTHPASRSSSNMSQVFRGNRETSMMDKFPTGGYSNDPYAYKKQQNIGNSCYMNSTMQILAACPIFVSQLDTAFKSLNNKSETFQIFHGLMRLLNGSFGTYKTVNYDHLDKMRQCLRKLDAIFDENGGKDQQDAEECLTALLGAVSDECTGTGFRKRDSGSRRSLGGGFSPVKTVKSPIKSIQAESDSIPDEKSEKEEEKKKKKMPAACDPVDLMEVKMRDVKTCRSCENTNEKDAMEHRVHLSMQEEKEGTLVAWTVKCVQQLLAAEVAQEEIIGDFSCEKCNTKSDAIGTKQFVQFGEYIIIVFKRFGYDENQRLRKLNTPIRVPLFLEMADFIQGEKKEEEPHPLDMTITIGEEARKSRRKEIKKPISPGVRVIGKTQDWADETEPVPVEELSQQLHDSVELVEEKKKDKKERERKRGKEGKEEEMGESVTSAREEEAMEVEDGGGEDTEKREAAGKEEESSGESIDILSAVSPSAAAAAVDEMGYMESFAPYEDPTDPALDPSPPRDKTPIGRTRRRLETPETLKEEVTSRSEMERKKRDTSTPSRKRTRQRPTKPKRGEEWLSTESRRSSLTTSEPSRGGKKSRLETGRTTSECTDSHSADEVTIVDEEMKTPRRSGENKTPCWKRTESTAEKKSAGSPFDFNDDEMEMAEMRKKGGTFRTRLAPKFAAPLKLQNVLPKKEEESRAKGSTPRRREKSENMAPSPLKTEMEQKGGGRATIESDEEPEEMEIDKAEGEEGMEGMDRGGGHDNVTRRSRMRMDKRTTRISNEKVEEERREEKEDGFSDEEEKDELTEDKKNEEEYCSQEGGFLKKDDEESSADEVVPSTPPEETEEGVEEEKREAAGREEKEDALSSTEGEEEEGEKTAKERDEKPMDTSSLQNESEVFDTPGKDGMETHKMNQSTSRKSALSAVADIDGQVRPYLSPPCSPVQDEVKEDEEGEKEEKAPIIDKEEEMEEEEDDDEEKAVEAARKKKEKQEKRIKIDTLRADWRRLFVDTDPPPPRDHIMFRPVDDRWMRSQSNILNMYCEVTKWSKDEDFTRLRAQSNLCKVDKAPAIDDVVQIDGDGNCLFRALSWWVTGSEENHSRMRKKIVGFMFRFPDEFGTRMSGAEGQKYTKENSLRMTNDGEWGTQCEIYGAATLLGVDIYTYHERKWKPYRPLFEWTFVGPEGPKVTRMTQPLERTRYGIYLENDANLHYDVVKYMNPVAPATDTCYRLLGSIQHHGMTACSGHYVADVYDQEKQQWLHCDDSTITKKSIIEVLENAMDHGYVLVYGKNKSMKKK